MIVICKSKSVVASRAYLHDFMILKGQDLLRTLNVVEVAMTTLTFIVGGSTTSPTEDTSLMIKCHRMEVTTVNLNYPAVLVYKGLDDFWLTTSLCLFVETSSPGENYSFLCQS